MVFQVFPYGFTDILAEQRVAIAAIVIKGQIWGVLGWFAVIEVIEVIACFYLGVLLTRWVGEIVAVLSTLAGWDMIGARVAGT